MNAMYKWLSMDRDDVLVIGSGFVAIYLFGFVCGYVVGWLTT